MHFRSSSVRNVVLATCIATAGMLSLAVNLPAQDAAPATPPAATPAPSGKMVFPDKYFEFYAGYSYFRPFHATLNFTDTNGTLQSVPYDSAHTGSVASISYFFSKYAGIQIQGGFNPDGTNDGFWLAHGGLVLHKPSHTFQPFGHILGGETEVAGPNGIKDYPYYHVWTWEPSVLVGGGVDYELPFDNHHFSVRIAELDYSFLHANFGTNTANGNDGDAGISALQMSAGLVYHPGWTPVPVAYACVVNPTSVFPGDPVTVTGTATGLNPKKKAVYTWSGQGVTVKGDGPTATIDTSTLSAGNYAITGHVSEGKKPNMMADCTASVTVKAFEPPTLTCSAQPDTVTTGGTSTITATGVSPQNRPLTYTFSASSGTISGTGNTATLSVGGAPAGSITVTCNTADDKGQTASATTTVNVTVPTPPVVPHATKLCMDTPAIGFTDPKRPARVNNEAKACLDAVTLAAKTQSDATLVVVGEAAPGGAEGLAAQRAANTKEFLTTEEGLDASRISIRTGTGGTDTVETYIVPAGATFDNDFPGTTAVDDSVKPQPRMPLRMRKHGHKHHHHAKAKG